MPNLPLRPAIIAALAAVLILAGTLGDGRAPAVSAGPSVQPQVYQAIARQPEIDVIVTLQAPPALASSPSDLRAIRFQVASRQAQVLAGLPAGGLALKYRYAAVPALAGRITAAGLAALSQRPDVIEIALDGEGVAATTQSAALIHADEVHASGLTGAGVVVAVLDSGIDTDHPDLAGDVLYEVCFLKLEACPEAPHPAEDNFGHGTNVAGIITGDGQVAPLGIAPDAKLAVYKILASNGSGRFSDWIAALDDIIANHPEVDIVNMSLQSGNACPLAAMAAAISILRDSGVPTFIAAGNHGIKDALAIPACLGAAISVGATYDGDNGRVDGWKVDCTDETTSADQVACWSDSDATLDLLAPGASITSTRAGGGAITFNGTSQAAPHAAAVAALVLQAFPDLSVDDLEARLKSTGKPVTDDLRDNDPSTNRTTPRIDARVALLADGDDTDGDGCTNGEEYGPDPRRGGQRNPLNPWDFYDVNGDGVVNIFDDILAVIAAAGPDTGPAYQPELDRSPAAADTAPWQQGPPDGTIDLMTDILGVVSQFGHRCAGPQ
ncbi:MAG: S8 family serine peptidase [Chloroflexi bacterium]|nr:S8 family serine peptidase [Chloroflexota bacterium]